MFNGKVLVVVATGFEDIELITVIDVFARENIKYDLVSIEDLNEVKGKYNAYVKTKLLNDINYHDYDALFLPGGPGTKILLQSGILIEIIKDYNMKKKIIAAICAAPDVLMKAEILNNKLITSYPGHTNNGNNTRNAYEIDGNIITGRDFEASLKFAIILVEELKKYKYFV